MYSWNSIIFIAIAISFISSSSAQDLTYNYSIPYAGAATLTINNEGSSSVLINSLVFTTNAQMNGNPWGSLFPWTATISSTPEGILNTYTVTQASTGLSIDAQSSLSLTYSFGSTGGPLGLGMGPSSVSASVNGGTLEDVDISGKCQGNECNDPTPGKQSSGYYTSWAMYARQYNAIDLPVKYINQIYYAFIGFSTSGEITLLDSNSDPKQIPVIAMLKQQYPYLKASLSFGGWTLSGPFSAMANSSDTRNAFVTNVVAALEETQFDGIDIDWEYPVVNGAPGESTSVTPQDAINFPLLLSDLRSGLDALAEKNKKRGFGATIYYLSITGAGGVDKIEAIQQYNENGWDSIIESVDVINIMAYDFHGAFDQSQPAPYDVSDFMSAMETSPMSPFYQSPLLKQYDVIDPMIAYTKLGFSEEQIGLGLPAYGRLVEVAQIGSTMGLWQTITGTPDGQYDNTGVFDYKCIQEGDCHGYKGLPDDMVFIEASSSNYGNMSQTPWGYSSSTLTFLTYDNSVSAKYKCCYYNNYRGYMVWDLSGDFPPSDPNSIVGACHDVLTNGC